MVRCRNTSTAAVAWLMALSLAMPAAWAQAPTRTASRGAPRSAEDDAPRRTAPPSYGPQRQPLRQAAAPTGNHSSALKQFAPRPRRPQPTWGQLSPRETADLDAVLRAWEEHSGEIRTLECEFQCWKYDTVFGAPAKGGKPPRPTRICRGAILYAAPDKGHYHITKQVADPANEQSEFKDIDGEHWVCDGNAVYEFDHDKKQLVERRLPNQLKGKAISNSPLPFVFGTTAEKMRQRYWMRLRTPNDLVGKEVWLQVEPIYAEDRANYQSATVILDENRMLPRAVALQLPNGSRTNYMFDPPSINNPLKKILGYFKVPSTPAGWKHIIEEPPAAEPRQPTESAQRPRPPRSILRK